MNDLTRAGDKVSSNSKDTSLEQLAGSLNFFLHKAGDGFYLKNTNSYYYQMQGQLHTIRRMWCDFVVGTLCILEMVVERISYDSEFWGRMYPKLNTFTLAPCCQNCMAPWGIHHVGLFAILLQIDRSVAMTEGPLNSYYQVYTMPVYIYTHTVIIHYIYIYINTNSTSPYKIYSCKTAWASSFFFLLLKLVYYMAN